MRCTNEVKNKIRKDLNEAISTLDKKLNEKISKETDRVNKWTNDQFINLQNLVRPIVYEWAKNLKKNYSSYIWKNLKTSEDLTNAMLTWNFGCWHYCKPEATSKTLENLTQLSREIDKQQEALLMEAYIKVAECKNLSELYEMIESYKEKAKNLYADPRSSKKSS